MEGSNPFPLLNVENLSIATTASSSPHLLVENVSFRIDAGDAVALVGESGSGKTLTALSLVGLLPPAVRMVAGTLTFAGQALAGKHAFVRIRGRKIAMIFQDPVAALNPVFRVGKQLSDTIRTHQKMSRKQAQESIRQLFEKVQLRNPDRIYRSYPHQLSGGMAQRVMIAMALSCSPRLIIADEPTTALDVTTQFQILQQIKALQKEMHFALLLISHDMHVVAHLTDHIMIMEKGQIIERGATAEVFRQPREVHTKQLLDSVCLSLVSPKEQNA